MKINLFVNSIVTTYLVLPSVASKSTDRSLTEQDNVLRYGDSIIIQNNAMDNRWLSGARSSGNEQVITRHALGSDYEISKAKDSYRWIIQSEARGKGQKDLSKDCLRYGDKFLLKTDVSIDRWISGSRGSGNEGVVTRDMLKSSYEKRAENGNYRWIARSNQGIGTRSNHNNEDPAYGLCIEKNSLVYLQNNAMDNRWLSGSRSSGNESVVTRNILQSAYEKRGFKSYTWILKTTFGQGNGSDSLKCAATSSTGRWVPLAYSNGHQEIKYAEGVEESRTKETSFERSTNWNLSVTKSITGGFDFKAFSASSSLEISASIGGSFSNSVSEAVGKTASEEFSITTSFGPGQVWQFVYEVRDLCYDGTWDLKMNDLVLTAGKHEPPCCLPGYAVSVGSEHGPCSDGTPCSCSKDVCSGEVGCGGLRG